MEAVTNRDPLVALAPLHAPVPVQLVALVDDHVRVVLPPCVKDEGEAEMATDGAGVTATDETARVELCVVVPPVPVQASVYEKFPATADETDAVPLVALLPVHAPEAMQLEALLDDHDKVAAWPVVTAPGLIATDTTGKATALTITGMFVDVVPPAPVQAKT